MKAGGGVRILSLVHVPTQIEKVKRVEKGEGGFTVDLGASFESYCAVRMNLSGFLGFFFLYGVGLD